MNPTETKEWLASLPLNTHIAIRQNDSVFVSSVVAVNKNKRHRKRYQTKNGVWLDDDGKEVTNNNWRWGTLHKAEPLTDAIRSEMKLQKNRNRLVNTTTDTWRHLSADKANRICAILDEGEL